MILLTKTCLRPGRIRNCTRLEDDDPRPATVRFSASTLKRWEKQHRTFRRQGLLSPIYLDHDQPAELLSRDKFQRQAKRDKRLVGFLRSFKATGDGANVELQFHNPKAARMAMAGKLELSPRLNTEYVFSNGRMIRNLLVSFDLVDEAADKSQTPFRRRLLISPHSKAKTMKTTKQRTRMNTTNPGNESADAMDLSKLNDREKKMLRRIHDTIRELGPQSDPLATALRILWPSQAAEIVGDGDGEEEVKAVQPGLAALSLDRRKVGSREQHSYEGGNRCSAEQAQNEVAKLKERHPGMFK